MQIRKRHSAVLNLLHLPVRAFLSLKFGYTFTPAKDLPDNYIVLSNHTTDFDPLFVALSLKNICTSLQANT